jgi:hypothetical protein
LTVYQKSAAAIAELQAKERTLGGRHRQVLILIDGQRSRDEISQLLRIANFDTVIDELLAQALIIDPNQPSSTTQPSSIHEIPPILLGEVSIATIRDIITSSSDTHLGIMGRPFKQRIMSAIHMHDIKACVSQWHMAMRESKSGRNVANALLSEVQVALQQS